MTQGPVQIALVVEGHGEVHGLPILVRRIAHEMCGEPFIVAHTPYRIPKSKMLKPRELERVVRLQAGRVEGTGGVVVLTDSDDDEPEGLRALLQATTTTAAAALAAAVVVVAVREYEAWFLAAIESLRSHKSVSDNAAYAGDPEEPRNAKLALEKCMTESCDSIRHQPAFNAHLDIAAAAARAPSLQRFIEAIETIVRQARGLAVCGGPDRD